MKRLTFTQQAVAVVLGLILGLLLATGITYWFDRASPLPIEIVGFEVDPTELAAGDPITITTIAIRRRSDCHRTVMRQVQSLSDSITITFDSGDATEPPLIDELDDGFLRIVAETRLPEVIPPGPALLRNVAIRLCPDGNTYLTLSPWVKITIIASE